jgi:Chalcone isomerase-like
MKLSRHFLYLTLSFLITMSAIPASANVLPEALVKDHMGLSVRGEGLLRFFGMKVYDARLWTQSKAHSFADTFALELVYDLGLKGKDIAERSVAEMRKQGLGDDAKLARWGTEMARIFPDIKKGDTLIGVFVPGKEARFFSRDKLIAAIPDPEFAKAFFDIWLSEKTSEPKLREKLLGVSNNK